MISLSWFQDFYTFRMCTHNFLKRLLWLHNNNYVQISKLWHFYIVLWHLRLWEVTLLGPIGVDADVPVRQTVSVHTKQLLA